MAARSYITSPRRVILGLIAGSVTGASSIVLFILLVAVATSGLSDVLRSPLLVYVFVVALAVWAVGLVIFGLPIWWCLHRRRIRYWWVAAITGAALAFIVDMGINSRLFELIPSPTGSTYSAGDSGGMTIIENHLTAHGWWTVVQGALLRGVEGVLVALVVWRIAYRRDDLLS